MAEQEEEDRLVESAGRGDAAAIGELYRRCAPAVFRYLFYRLGDRELAEDMTSEVFARALESLPRYRSRGRPFSTWLYRIAAARVADHYRQGRRRPSADLPVEAPAPGPGVAAEVERRLTAEQLQRALEQLPPLQQQVIVLRFLERLSHQEVGRIIGRREGTVRVLQYRALAALRRILQNVEE